MGVLFHFLPIIRCKQHIQNTPVFYIITKCGSVAWVILYIIIQTCLSLHQNIAWIKLWILLLLPFNSYNRVFDIDLSQKKHKTKTHNTNKKTTKEKKPNKTNQGEKNYKNKLYQKTGIILTVRTSFTDKPMIF